MKQTVLIEGMKCEGCSQSVTRLFLELEGVQSVSVDREAKTAAIETAREIPRAEYDKALAETKFSVSGVE